MSDESSEGIAGWDCVRDALDEIRASSSQFEEFFAEVFGELDSLFTDLGAQRQKWHQEHQQTHNELGRRAAQVEEDRAALTAQRESASQINQVTAEGVEQAKLLLEEARREREELHGAEQTVEAQVQKLKTVALELAAARSELTEKVAASGNEQLGLMFQQIQQQQEELRNAGNATRSQAEQLAAVAAELTSAHAEMAQGSTPASDEQLKQIIKEIQQQQAGLQGAQESARGQTEQLVAVSGELADARRELGEAKDQILKQCEKLTTHEKEAMQTHPDDALDVQVCQMERQQLLLQQERQMLETELEAVRNRAAETAESLADQKRLSAEQQKQWAEELKRMRRLLENMSVRLAEAELSRDTGQPQPRPAAKEGKTRQSAPTNGDPALDSVVAQFEMLQRDILQRRAAKA